MLFRRNSKLDFLKAENIKLSKENGKLKKQLEETNAFKEILKDYEIYFEPIYIKNAILIKLINKSR